MLSFDSSAWLFLWHFGVAMWIEDHIQKKPEAIGYSGRHRFSKVPVKRDLLQR
jgi:hypothetical protein